MNPQLAWALMRLRAIGQRCSQCDRALEVRAAAAGPVLACPLHGVLEV